MVETSGPGRTAVTAPAGPSAGTDPAERHLLPGYLGLVALDVTGTCRYASESLAGRFGLEVADVVGAPIFDVVHPDDVHQAAVSFSETAERRGLHQPIELRLVGADGSGHAVEVVAENRLDDPAVAAVVVSISDVEDRRRSTRLLTTQAEVVERIALRSEPDAAMAAIVAMVENAVPGARATLHQRVDHGGYRVAGRSAIDPSWLAVVAGEVGVEPTLPATEALRTGTAVVAHRLDDPAWRRAAEVLGPRGFGACWSVPVVASTTAETIGVLDIWIPDAVPPRPDEWPVLTLATRLVAIAVHHDQLHRTLRHQAGVDPVTATPNRRVMERLVGQALLDDRARPLVVFADLDRLKVINDSLGHGAGDAVIAWAAAGMTRAIDGRGVVGRFGGDEFVVLADATDFEDPTELARCLHTAFDEPARIGDRTMRITASLGIVAVTDQRSATEVLRDADAAMYEAKRSGSNTFRIFDPAIRVGLDRRLTIEHQLRGALAQRAVQAHYQPIVSLTTGEVVSVEALARWDHDGRPVSPAEFVPVAEETGLIIDLGRHMLDQATHAAAHLLRRDLSPGRMSVNVSPVQVRVGDLVDTVMAAVTRRGLPPGTMCLEVTENLLLDEADSSRHQLEALDAEGVCVAIDDFGTGYSSLAYLHRLPVTALKVDHRLVAGIGTRSGWRLLEAAVGMARALGLVSVAEGVEDPTVAGRLRDLGFDAAQGFAFAPALPLAELEDRLGRDRPWECHLPGW